MFFFSSRRRHTRLVSDWSSDVCSSDLHRELLRVHNSSSLGDRMHFFVNELCELLDIPFFQLSPDGVDLAEDLHFYRRAHRSEERRVGKECRSRVWPYHYKNKRVTAECV